MRLQDLIDYAASRYHIYEEYRWKDFPDFSVFVYGKSNKWLALLMRSYQDGERVECCDLRCGKDILNTKRSYISMPYRMKGDNWVGIRFNEETEDKLIFDLFDKAVKDLKPYTYTIILDNSNKLKEKFEETKPLRFSNSFFIHNDKVPAKIEEMRKMYRFGNGFYEDKAFNFVSQGRFMEDYEDNEFWDKELKIYFPSYHDLSIRQLRGYFSWRTSYRKGEFRKTNITFIYLYIYELLNGIGANAIEDRLQKITEFAKIYKEQGLLDDYHLKNIRRWCFELSLINDLPKAIVTSYLDPLILEKDHALSVLKKSELYNDEEVFEALSLYATHKLKNSPILKRNKEAAYKLFADLWKKLNEKDGNVKENFFERCFGQFMTFRFYPLGNAIYYQQANRDGFVYELSDNIGYSCKDKKWYRHGYNEQLFDKRKFDEVMHEADRYLRNYLKTGRPLKEKAEEKWVDVYLQRVIEDYEESLKPKIVIDMSSLDKIRHDASLTRDSLLVEEEAEEVISEAENIKEETSMDIHMEILKDLLEGKDVDQKLKDSHLMPEIVADQINETAYETIGDMIVECEDNTLKIVEDYKDEILKLLEGL
ncbi:MAG: TerB N-terminal domain-containing protein [Erysipelotrichaceae bacterium]|nr:TerB N-terminal domain-containing protein [Erysipelotrichaceae bacterium]